LKRLASNFARLNLHADVVVADIVSLKARLSTQFSSTRRVLARNDPASPGYRLDQKTPRYRGADGTSARLLDKAVALVKPGGMIVYCTCSIEPEENEMQISALLRREPSVVRVR